MAYSYRGTLSVSDSYQGTLSVSDDGSSGLSGELNYGVQSLSPVSTSDYNTLTNKPRINNVELVGNITTERLGIRNGEDGFSPVITERETELGYDITITDVEGSNTITLRNGTNGLDGTNGQDGKSAYDIAVEQGFQGTEQEWLESLKGQDGKDGIVMDAPSDGKVYGRMNANWVEVTGGGGTTITVDNILSTTSENPVQNKVITEELNKKADQTTVDESLALKANSADVTASLAEKSDIGHTHDDRYYTEAEIDTKLSEKIDNSIKGVANGVAELDSNGKVLTAQLPSYVDDVLEYSGISDFPTEGETGKIYVDTTTNKTYRWSGSTYIEISESIALGETSSTAYRGDRGKIAYDHSQSPHAPADAEANVQSDWNETDTTSDAYILNKPASLPADGGNADTVGGKHASDFFNNIAGLITPESSGKDTLLEYIKSINSSTSNFYTSSFDDLPTNNWGYNVTVYKAGGAIYVIAYKALSNSEIYVRCFTSSGEWNGDWTRLNDGGNADTLDGKHASDFVENMLNQNYHFSMVFGDHAYITTEMDSNVPNLPIVSNYTHIVSRRDSGEVETVLSIGADYTKNVYAYRKTDGIWKNLSDGGNADKLDGLHESSFAQNIGVWNEGDIKDLLLACQKSGFVWIQPGVTGMPSDNMYWFGIADCHTVHRQLIVRNISNNVAYSISWNNGVQKWYGWSNIADGGNAASVGAYTEAKIAALEARIAALEAKG